MNPHFLFKPSIVHNFDSPFQRFIDAISSFSYKTAAKLRGVVAVDHAMVMATPRENSAPCFCWCIWQTMRGVVPRAGLQRIVSCVYFLMCGLRVVLPCGFKAYCCRAFTSWCAACLRLSSRPWSLTPIIILRKKKKYVACGQDLQRVSISQPPRILPVRGLNKHPVRIYLFMVSVCAMYVCIYT